jgi:hypothetical protein
VHGPEFVTVEAEALSGQAVFKVVKLDESAVV